MTPHEFCHWLRGYLAAEPFGVAENVLREFEKVDMTSFFIPPISDDDSEPPASACVFVGGAGSGFPRGRLN